LTRRYTLHNDLLVSLLDRLRSWVSPERRRERRTAARQAWDEAVVEADQRRDRQHPRPEGFYDRGKSDPPK
jgi:hypothetical protein